MIYSFSISIEGKLSMAPQKFNPDLKSNGALSTNRLSRRNFLAGVGLFAGSFSLLASGCTQVVEPTSEQPETNNSANKDKKPVSSENFITTFGEGMGKHGHVKIGLLTSPDKIEDIYVVESRETKGIGDVCMEKLSKLIVDNQTLNVDMITGATLSSVAFVQAVDEALKKSQLDAEEFKKKDKAVLSIPEKPEASYDVVVVGAGGAGLTASICAAVKGCKVLLLEKLGVLGGSTALSGGEMAVPQNWIQEHSGIEDSPEKLTEDMLKGGDYKGDPELVKVIANGVKDAADWLTYEGGVSWEHNLLFFGGHSVKRSIIPKEHIGNAMTTALTDRTRSLDNLTVLSGVKATELKADANGMIEGITAQEVSSGDVFNISTKAVVLSCGGFGANVDKRTEANPEFGKQFNATTSVGAMGDGLDMAQAIGAETIDMELIQTYPICDIETGALLYLDDMRLDERTVMFNKEGKRFVEELERRDVLSKAILSQTDEIAYEIWDQDAADETKVVDIHSDEYENLTSRKLCVTANTIEEACEPFGIDAAALKETLTTWNNAVDSGKDEEFNYRGEMHKIQTPPYYIMVYKPAVHYTMGGLHINTEAEVLDTNQKAIKGLYAAGEVAGHKMGANRLGSTSMADIYTFGRIAGDNAADFALGK